MEDKCESETIIMVLYSLSFQDAEKDEHFKVILSDPTDGAQLGSKVKTVITIVNDEGMNIMMNKFTRQDENIRKIYMATWLKMVQCTELNVSKL